MNLEQKLARLTDLYGSTCVYCRVVKANDIDYIVPLQHLKHSRKLNKRASRKNRRDLPIIANNYLGNLLPVCSGCKVKRYQLSIYSYLNDVQLRKIDNSRQEAGFLLISQCNNQSSFLKCIAKTLTTN
ncbi:MAG TPA: hypothetical protein PLP75_01245 [Burkholderiales bacterium]|nr:hypothetical protein [Burkholderiales bacterium]